MNEFREKIAELAIRYQSMIKKLEAMDAEEGSDEPSQTVQGLKSNYDALLGLRGQLWVIEEILKNYHEGMNFLQRNLEFMERTFK